VQGGTGGFLWTKLSKGLRQTQLMDGILAILEGLEAWPEGGPIWASGLENLAVMALEGEQQAGTAT
jgi:hypothetical protein